MTRPLRKQLGGLERRRLAARGDDKAVILIEA
jgi:hypothetical protein